MFITLLYYKFIVYYKFIQKYVTYNLKNSKHFDIYSFIFLKVKDK